MGTFRGNVLLYAQESQVVSAYSSLQGFDREMPMSSLLAEFRKHKWGPQAKLDDRQISIRFVVKLEEIVSDFLKISDLLHCLSRLNCLSVRRGHRWL